MRKKEKHVHIKCNMNNERDHRTISISKISLFCHGECDRISGTKNGEFSIKSPSLQWRPIKILDAGIWCGLFLSCVWLSSPLFRNIQLFINFRIICVEDKLVDHVKAKHLHKLWGNGKREREAKAYAAKGNGLYRTACTIEAAKRCCNINNYMDIFCGNIRDLAPTDETSTIATKRRKTRAFAFNFSESLYMAIAWI